MKVDISIIYKYFLIELLQSVILQIINSILKLYKFFYIIYKNQLNIKLF